MDTDKKTEGISGQFNLARLGLGIGALGLFCSTAYMNISGWVAQAEDTAQAIANGALAAGFELMALCGLAWAGYQWAKGRKPAAIITAGIAVAAIIFNTFAAENFLHLQAEAVTNGIEASAQNVDVIRAEISSLEMERQGIIDNNGGRVPRPIEAIEAYYGRFDPESNPINMSRKAAEIELRREYERIQSELSQARRSLAGDAVAANDTARTVIPTSMLGPFVWVLEFIKGTVFFALGNAEGDHAQRKALEDRQKWAIIRKKNDAYNPKGFKRRHAPRGDADVPSPT